MFKDIYMTFSKYLFTLQTSPPLTLEPTPVISEYDLYVEKTSNLIFLIFTASIVILVVTSIFHWNLKKNKNKKYDSFLNLGYLMFIFLSIPACVAYFGSIFQYPRVFTFGTSDGWISFIGSLIGSGITLMGIVITLNVQEKARNEDKLLNDDIKKEEYRVNFLPVFTKIDPVISELPNPIQENLSLYPTALTPEQGIIPMRIVKFSLKNSGRSEAYDVEMFLITQPKIYEVHDKFNKKIVESGDYTFKEGSSNNFGLLGIGDKIENILLLKLPTYNNQLTEFKFLLKYKDFIGNHYEQRINLELSQTASNKLFIQPLLTADSPTLLKK